MTVFASDGALSKSTQEILAKDCEWESVMVSKNDSSTEMSFHMPSGEEVSFCAHAALGGAYACFENVKESLTFQASMTKESQTVQIEKEEQMATLYMRTQFEETPVSHSPLLQRLLREHLGITSKDLIPTF